MPLRVLNEDEQGDERGVLRSNPPEDGEFQMDLPVYLTASLEPFHRIVYGRTCKSRAATTGISRSVIGGRNPAENQHVTAKRRE